MAICIDAQQGFVNLDNLEIAHLCLYFLSWSLLADILLNLWYTSAVAVHFVITTIQILVFQVADVPSFSFTWVFFCWSNSTEFFLFTHFWDRAKVAGWPCYFGLRGFQACYAPHYVVDWSCYMLHAGHTTCWYAPSAPSVHWSESDFLPPKNQSDCLLTCII